jgi:hypothetical protein
MPLTETTDSISAVPSNVIYVETVLKSEQYFNGSRHGRTICLYQDSFPVPKVFLRMDR